MPVVLAAFGLEGGEPSSLGNGLINQTWRIQMPDGRRFVLQQVNAVFPRAINDDIDAVTQHLAGKGLLTPVLLHTRTGDCCFEHGGSIWRVLSWIEGIAHDLLHDGAQAHEAGMMLARFHRAVADLGCHLSNPRPGVHDTPHHLRQLRTALAEHRSHPAAGPVGTLAGEILDAAARLPALPATPDRIVHGDPKISNILFAPDGGRALCMVDFDTLARMPLPLELGDAFRSWCNPAGEDTIDGEFSLELFEAGVAGYLSEAAGWIRLDEARAIVPATRTILVELAARFCADALNESYFAWDPTRFPSRTAHNQVRAAGQLAVARALDARQQRAEDIVMRAIASSGISE